MPSAPPDVDLDLATRAHDPATPAGDLFLPATAIVLADAGALILGAPGAGKSSLALALIAVGATLLCDDGVIVAPGGDALTLTRPATAPPLIEARGIGLLPAGPIVTTAPLALVVDFNTASATRLPNPTRAGHLGRTVPLVRGRGHPDLAPVIAHILRHGPPGAPDTAVRS